MGSNPGYGTKNKNLVFSFKNKNTDSYCLISFSKEFNSAARGHWNCCYLWVAAIGAVKNSVTQGNPVNYLCSVCCSIDCIICTLIDIDCMCVCVCVKKHVNILRLSDCN